MIITADFLIEFFKAYWWVFLSWQLRDSLLSMSCSTRLLSQDGIVIPMDKVLATAVKTPERVPENKSRGGNSNLISAADTAACLLYGGVCS